MTPTQRELLTYRNVGAALRQTLRSCSDGAPESAIIEAIVGAGVERKLVEDVIRVFILSGWITRSGDRLFHGVG